MGFVKILKAEKISNQCYKLFYYPNQAKCARLGIIASKKCMKTAVQRNLNKRLVREVFRCHPIKLKQIDLVVMIRQEGLMPETNQRESLATLFSRLELRCVPS